MSDINKISDSNTNQSSKSKTLIMGILNITPDSFYDGGRHNTIKSALLHTEDMISEGADIIDVGGESSRPGSKPVSESEELDRVIPVINEIKKKFNIPISIDTTKSVVAKHALQCGATIVNDISGLSFDPIIAEVVSRYNSKIILCHTSSRPVDMQNSTNYINVVNEIYNYLQNSIKLSVDKGILEDSIYIDPGIGFGKTVEHNLLLLKSLSKFKALKKKIVIGTSMKSFISKLLESNELYDREDGTLATVVISVLNGAEIVRVHNVKKMKTAIKIADSINNIN